MASSALVSNEKSRVVVSSVRNDFILLACVFVVSLSLLNPIVHGDGVGYYAYLRAPLIQHNLRFEEDWRHANLGFAETRTDALHQVHRDQYAETGYINNLFSVGPAILWSPFFLLAHGAVLVADRFGAGIPADGFSLPYRASVAFGTALYGFCGLLLTYSFASKYVSASSAVLATLGVWAASSLPVYMYFNPFWSHALSTFVVALFIWFWDRTRPNRTYREWLILGIISGLLVDVYFVNGVFLLIPLVESIAGYWNDLLAKNVRAGLDLFGANLLYLGAFGISIVPTLVTRRIVFGSMLRFGSYTSLAWNWHAPFWRVVLFSSDHGLLTWTPLLGLAILGLFLPLPSGRGLHAYLAIATVFFYFVIASYPYWDGTSSFGNRFFISLTPVFVFGLAVLIERVSEFFRPSQLVQPALSLVIGLFGLWNLAFIFQWGTHMIPVRGPISWDSAIHQQVVDVPQRITHGVEAYFTRRGEMMQHIEQQDIEQQQLEEKQGQ
jgi:hypothetical protein